MTVLDLDKHVDHETGGLGVVIDGSCYSYTSGMDFIELEGEFSASELRSIADWLEKKSR